MFIVTKRKLQDLCLQMSQRKGRLKIVRDLENHAHTRVSAHTYAHTHVGYFIENHTLDE